MLSEKNHFNSSLRCVFSKFSHNFEFFSKKISLTTIDKICAFVFCVALLGETLCDEQQWLFHQAKRYVRLSSAKAKREFLKKQSIYVRGRLENIDEDEHLLADVRRGFSSQGTFAVSRHLVKNPCNFSFLLLCANREMD